MQFCVSVDNYKDVTSNKMSNVWKKLQFIFLIFNKQEKTRRILSKRERKKTDETSNYGHQEKISTLLLS